VEAVEAVAGEDVERRLAVGDGERVAVEGGAVADDAVVAVAVEDELADAAPAHGAVEGLDVRR
jgi:hypothetical protein